MMSFSPAEQCPVKLTIKREKNTNFLMKMCDLKIKINNQTIGVLKSEESKVVYLSFDNYKIEISAFGIESKVLFLNTKKRSIVINARLSDTFDSKVEAVVIENDENGQETQGNISDYIGIYIPKTEKNKKDTYGVHFNIKYNVIKGNGTKTRLTQSKYKMHAGDYIMIPRDGCEQGIHLERERTSFFEDNSECCGSIGIQEKDGTRIMFIADSPEGIFNKYTMREITDEGEILKDSPRCIKYEKTIMEMESVWIDQERKNREHFHKQKKNLSYSCAFGIEEKFAFNNETESFFILGSDGDSAVSGKHLIKNIASVEFVEVPAFSNPIVYTSIGEGFRGQRGREIGAMMALDAKTKLARVEMWITVSSGREPKVLKAKTYDPLFSFYKRDSNYLKAVGEYKRMLAYIQTHNNAIADDNKENRSEKPVSSDNRNDSIRDRLKSLNELLDEGLITKDEYDEKRRKILDMI